MIAYGHYIAFIPDLADVQKVDGVFKNTVTVKEVSLENLPDTLRFEMTFPQSQGRELSLHTDREFDVTQKDQVWAFKIKGVVTFFWYSGSMEILHIKDENFSEYLLQYWLLHVVLPVFFIIEGIYDFLHAGAVEVGEKPILFIAPSMGGKSTLTDYFMRQGHTMISDDKVATIQKDGDFYAVSSYQYHRPYRNIEDMGKYVSNFANLPKKLGVIYALESVPAEEDVKINQILGIEKYKALRSAKEMNLFFDESIQFDFLSKIAKEVEVFQVSVPWDTDRLSDVYQAIMKHQQKYVST